MSRHSDGPRIPRIVYLTDTHGDTTGHYSSVADQFTHATLNKLPLDRSLHPVRAYIAAYGNQLVLLARLDFEYAHPWHLNDAAQLPCKEAVAAYANAATAAMRANAIKNDVYAHCTIPLPCSETEPGTVVTYVAFDINFVRDAKHAASLIKLVFADLLALPRYPTPADDETAMADAYGGHWGAHPEYTVTDWTQEVTNGDTRLGYWRWVAGEARRAIEDAVATDLASLRPIAGPSL